MIFKSKDSLDDRLACLEAAVSKSFGRERNSLEREIAILKSGEKGELDTAYYVDFELKDSKFWAVIHDLRIEWNGRTAQIDHLLIDRLLEIYVIESKSFRAKVRYANGGWERLNFNHWEGIPSPVEQNERHIKILSEMISELNLAPTRLGMKPRYENIVAVQPSCSIVGVVPKDARVYRTDMMVKKIQKSDATVVDMLRIVSPESVWNFASRLVGLHKPVNKSDPNRGKLSGFGLSVASTQEEACHECKGPLSKAEANFCQTRKSVFAGLLLCRKCQSFAKSKVETASVLKETPPAYNASAKCSECATPVESKVVSFCRIKSKVFGGRILCRDCQGKISHGQLAASN